MSLKEVYALHIPTSRQRLLVKLRWNPTSIASGHGWVCLGGYEKGICAFLDLQDVQLFGKLSNSFSAEVDESLPLRLTTYFPPSSFIPPPPPPPETAPPEQQVIFIEKEIGRMIVNGITISKFANNQSNIPDDTVVVLSNNDKTVTIWSLTKKVTQKRIDLPKAINHASISPNGEILVAVGDVNDVWFYQRSIRKRLSGQPYFDWRELAAISLVSTVKNDWCFSTAWSPSGHMCIVASQFGVLTVFETSKIKKDMDHTDAIIYSMKSSRAVVCDPSAFIPSAPRSMAFSPEPWDLVAWAEDHGRITIADLRDGFASRQTIEVDTTADNVERILPTLVTVIATQLQDTPVITGQQDQEALQPNDAENALQHAVQYLEGAAAQRSSPSTARYSSEPEPTSSNMAESEQYDVEIESEPREQEDGNEEASTPYSINYSDPISETVSSPTQQPLTLGEYMLNRTDIGQMPASWSPPRRRRSSVVVSPYSGQGPDRDLRSAYQAPGRLAHLPFSTSPSRLSEGPLDTNREYPGPTSFIHSIPNSHPHNSDSASLQPVLQPSSLEDHRPSHQGPRSDIPGLSSGEARNRVAEAMRRFNYPASTTRDSATTDRLLREQARSWGRRINELRERAGQLGVVGSGAIGTPDLSFLDQANDIVLGRETISRARAAAAAGGAGTSSSSTVQRLSVDGEISIQGIGWSWDGRYL